MFLTTNDYPFTRDLEANHETIKRELMRLGEHEYIVQYPQKSVYDFGWDMFGLYVFGKEMEACTALCPETRAIVTEIPGMVGAGFSILRAGATIDWHRDPMGYSEYIYRCHLGMVVPEDCHFTVGAESRPWREAETLIFEGDQLHKAENKSDRDRIVLMIDVKRDLDHHFEMPPFNPSDWIPISQN